jgi:hypothetical protein
MAQIYPHVICLPYTCTIVYQAQGHLPETVSAWPEFIRRRTPLTYDWPAFLPLSFPEILPVFRFRQEASFAATVVSAQSLPLIVAIDRVQIAHTYKSGRSTTRYTRPIDPVRKTSVTPTRRAC